MIFVSVFDDRGGASLESIANTLLLCASWHAHMPGSGASMQLHVVRPQSSKELQLIESLGVEIIEQAKPHYLNTYSPTYNKLLGILDKKRVPTVLLDNDTFFHSTVLATDTQLSGEFVMANVADRQRVSYEIMAEVESEIGLKLIPEAWLPWEYIYDDARESQPPRSVKGLYFNSGVVYLPEKTNLQWIWQRHSKQICEYFAARYEKHKQRGAFGSDQLSLSTAIEEHGNFKTLPCEYNYRIYNFLNGDAETADQVKIVHNAGIRKAKRLLEEREQSFELRLLMETFYRDIVRQRIIDDSLGDKERRIAVVESVLVSLTNCLDACDLDQLDGWIKTT